MACLEHVRKEWAKTLSGGHDTVVLSGLEIMEARPGFLVARLPIKKTHLNDHGTVHGGCVMTLVDTVPWLSLVTLGYPVGPSVSTNMSCELVRPCGTEGGYLYAEGTAVKQGRTLAFTRVTFKVDGRVTGFGSHTLVVTPLPFEYTFTEDGKERVPVKPEEPKAKM